MGLSVFRINATVMGSKSAPDDTPAEGEQAEGEEEAKEEAKDEAKESYSIEPHEENLQQTERYTLCDVLEGKDC